MTNDAGLTSDSKTCVSQIELTKATITSVDGQTTSIPARVVDRLWPQQVLAVESDELPSNVLDGKTHELAMKECTVPIRMGLLSHSFPQRDGIKGALVPDNLPALVAETNTALQSVRFDVFNFVAFYGSADRHIQHKKVCRRIGVALIKADPWLIEITAKPDLDEIIKNLEATGRIAATHTACIKRMDDAAFSVGDVSGVLNALRTFLSFARGAGCGSGAVEGRAPDGKPIWVRWGMEHVMPWADDRSWLLKMKGGDVIAGLFPRFLRLFERRHLNVAIRHAVDWYIHSNNAAAAHVGIILTQAALEVLSNQTPASSRAVKASAARLKNALDVSGIPIDIPSHFNELIQLSKKQIWQDGPLAFNRIRNAFVHHDNAHVHDVRANMLAYVQAGELGQWYVEMLLLRQLNYKEDYSCRIAAPDGSHVKRVPWA